MIAPPRLGFLGAGWIGRHQIQAIERAGGARVVAVADSSIARRTAALANAPDAVACDHLGRMNVPISWGPGRHGISHNIFVYHRDPDDQMIEFYTEMDQMLDEELGYFDPRPWHKDRPQRPKVWDRQSAALVWGPPQGPDHARQRNIE